MVGEESKLIKFKGNVKLTNSSPWRHDYFLQNEGRWLEGIRICVGNYFTRMPYFSFGIFLWNLTRKTDGGGHSSLKKHMEYLISMNNMTAGLQAR